MKVLEIREENAYLCCGNNGTKSLAEIDGDDLLQAMKAIIDNDEIELDEYDENQLHNEALRAIYKPLREQFATLFDNKDALLASIDEEFADAESLYASANENQQ